MGRASWRVAAAAALAATAGSAAAAPTVVAWSTYLRAAPSQTSPALSELEHDTPLTVAGCEGGWCRVSGATFAGYVDQYALTLPRTTPPNPPARKDCVVVAQADNRGPIPTRFCSAAPPAAAAPPAGNGSGR